MKKMLLIFSCLVVFSCSKEYKTIDGTSKDTFEESVKSISSKLTILQQDKIQEAIKLIYKYKTSGSDEKKRWTDVYTLLNGKNAEQVFDLAEEIAKANKIAWSSTSMNTLNDSVFLIDDNIEPITQADEKLKQIDAATKIALRFALISPNPETNNGFYLFPELTDDEGKTIIFKDLPLTASISFINNGTTIYMVKRTFSSSDVGNVSLKKGLLIPYNLFDKGKLAGANVDVDMKINAGDKYLYGKLNSVPIDLSKTKDTSAEQQLSIQKGLDNVKTFIQDVGNKNYAKAFSLTKNPKWESEEKFASTSTGFGTIYATNLLSSSVISSSSDKMTIGVTYQIKDKNDKVKTLKQNFILKKISNNWLITDTEAKEAKDDTWKN
ncbi:MAG: hypothetical protein LBT29_01765 [Flavobacteriaceae bacterium]|jgi:hypothetical protein|nr:hypothetical protein [Flavobacteriaceae bacterium]